MNNQRPRPKGRTKKSKGRGKMRKFLILLLLLVAAAIIYELYDLNIIPHRHYTNADFGIDTYISQVDKDGDGIDDQTDILKGVRKYIATKPKYKSKYYDSGYPDDEYGVCTDVVAQGLLAAGYDLMELVDADMKNNPAAYNNQKPDKNIDFRRVLNLNVYFKHKAITLTTDINQIEEWQGGDIIVFKNHIGVISDRRNADGIPFLIHHGSPAQKKYEQDILANRDDIIGHYRIS